MSYLFSNCEYVRVFFNLVTIHKIKSSTLETFTSTVQIDALRSSGKVSSAIL